MMMRILPSTTSTLNCSRHSLSVSCRIGIGVNGGRNNNIILSSFSSFLSSSSFLKPLSTVTNRSLVHGSIVFPPPPTLPLTSSSSSSSLLWQSNPSSLPYHRHWSCSFSSSSSTIPGDVHEAQHFRTESALNDDPITSNLPNLPSSKQPPQSQQSSSSDTSTSSTTSTTTTAKSTMIHDSDLSSSNIGDSSCGSSGPQPDLGPTGPPLKHPPLPGQQPQPGTAEGALHSKVHINPSKGAAGTTTTTGVAGVAAEGVLGTGEFVSFTKLPSSRDVTSNVMNDIPRRELTTTENEPDVQQSQTSDPSEGHVFVVAIDGSDEAHWAWETATSLVRKDRDSLVMLTVPVPVSPYSHSPIEDGIGSSYHHEMIKRDADHWNAVKTSYENLCKERGINKYNYKLLPASNVPGDDLLTYAEHVGANFMVVGHRGMSAVKRRMKIVVAVSIEPMPTHHPEDHMKSKSSSPSSTSSSPSSLSSSLKPKIKSDDDGIALDDDDGDKSDVDDDDDVITAMASTVVDDDRRLMLGSVAYFMLQYAKCNVVLAKRQVHQQFSTPNPTPKIEADARPRRWAPQ